VQEPLGRTRWQHGAIAKKQKGEVLMATCSKSCKCDSCKSRSTKFYDKNPDARKKKAEYDTKYHSTSERRKYRSELVQKNRDMGSKKGDGLDVSHPTKKGGSFRLEKQKTNRARK